MLALGVLDISISRDLHIPTVGCSELDEFIEGGNFSFALPNKPDFSKDAKVRDRHLLYCGNLESTRDKSQTYSGGNKC
jgi:hypothetical protein